MILMGRSEVGKTTLIEALRGETLVYRKTQCIDYSEDLMDTPGEYAEGKDLAGALAVYSYEADVVALVVSATEHYCIFPPACTPAANRPVVGIVTKCDDEYADPKLATDWLLQCGCERVFLTSSKNNQGIKEILDYLQA